MKHEALWFRIGVVALVLAGALIVALSLRGHSLPRDETKLPSVVGPSPQTPAR